MMISGNPRNNYNNNSNNNDSSIRYPFTATQRQELEQQALVFKYMVSGMPVPPDLLFTIRRSFHSSLSSKLLLPNFGLYLLLLIAFLTHTAHFMSVRESSARSQNSHQQSHELVVLESNARFQNSHQSHESVVLESSFVLNTRLHQQSHESVVLECSCFFVLSIIFDWFSGNSVFGTKTLSPQATIILKSLLPPNSSHRRLNTPSQISPLPSVDPRWGGAKTPFANSSTPQLPVQIIHKHPFRAVRIRGRRGPAQARLARQLNKSPPQPAQLGQPNGPRDLHIWQARPNKNPTNRTPHSPILCLHNHIHNLQRGPIHLIKRVRFPSAARLSRNRRLQNLDVIDGFQYGRGRFYDSTLTWLYFEQRRVPPVFAVRPLESSH
ncbi:growth-regulating factor 5 [Striga asiatica]|uniref:Growth-regulating factor n=1 Tax=Striga asiatica TaxID=4170 RepID=A0A5A7Q9D9_STRAF|nr:growth-regulating factor 5 [Striga asiatica]